VLCVFVLYVMHAMRHTCLMYVTCVMCVMYAMCVMRAMCCVCESDVNNVCDVCFFQSCGALRVQCAILVCCV
jgi:hypothetical protein